MNAGFERIYVNNIDKKLKKETIKIAKPKTPCLTYNIKQMIKTRGRALNKNKSSKTERDFNFYKEMRNQEKYAIIREKRLI